MEHHSPQRGWLQISRYAVLIFFFCTIPFIRIAQIPALAPVFLALYVFGGAFHCGWHCPFALWQDATALLGRKLGIRQKPVPEKLNGVLIPLRYLMYALAAAGVTFMLYYTSKLDARFAARQLLNGRIISVAGLALMALFTLSSLFYKRLYCNYLCPEGALNGLKGGLRLFTIRRRGETCTSCKKCDHACPMSIRVSEAGDVRSLQCVNCFECLSACPVKGTLTYGLMRPEKDILGSRLPRGQDLWRRLLPLGLRLAAAAALFFYFFTLGTGH